MFGGPSEHLSSQSPISPTATAVATCLPKYPALIHTPHHCHSEFCKTKDFTFKFKTRLKVVSWVYTILSAHSSILTIDSGAKLLVVSLKHAGIF